MGAHWVAMGPLSWACVNAGWSYPIIKGHWVLLTNKGFSIGLSSETTAQTSVNQVHPSLLCTPQWQSPGPPWAGDTLLQGSWFTQISVKSLMGLSLSFQVLVKLTLMQGSAKLLFKVWAINVLGFEGWVESLLHIFYLFLFVFYNLSLLVWSVEGLH